MRVIWAFIVRDLRVAWSYRLSFFTQNAALISTMLSLKFVGTLVDEGQSESLKAYGGDYFSFALLGMAISFLSYPAVKSFSSAVRGAQVTGTFEAMLTTRASPLSIVIGGGIYGLVVACVQLFGMVAIGVVAFGIDIQMAHLALVLLVLGMTIAALMGIGLLSAAFTIAFKQTEPFSSAIIAASLLLSGIIYPSSVLPDWVRVFSPLIPITHSVELARQLLLPNASTATLGAHFAGLALFCLLLPVGALALRISIDYAKRAGSLAQY